MHRTPARSTVLKWTTRRLDVDSLQLRVLVVDDNMDAGDALSAYLSIENIDCRVAYGGRQAIQTAIDWDPHVILMDISMPECNGFEALLAVRHDARTAGIAIVAHTALDEAEVRRQVLHEKFDGYFQKAQSPQALIAFIRSFVH